MSWFEQDTSKARCIIIQFHCPAELKLRRMYRSVCNVSALPHVLTGHAVFLFEERQVNALWKMDEVDFGSQSDGKYSGALAGADALAQASVSLCFPGDFFEG